MLTINAAASKADTSTLCNNPPHSEELEEFVNNYFLLLTKNGGCLTFLIFEAKEFQWSVPSIARCAQHWYQVPVF